LVNNLEQVKFGDETAWGIGDLEIGTKIELGKFNEGKTEMAFLSHLSVPTGSSGFTNDTYGSINKLSIAHTLSENVGLGYNVGFDYFGGDIDDQSLTYSLALGVGVTEKVAIYVEPYGAYSISAEDFNASFDAGFTYLLQDNLQADFSFGTGLNYSMNYFSVGVSWMTK